MTPRRGRLALVLVFCLAVLWTSIPSVVGQRAIVSLSKRLKKQFLDKSRRQGQNDDSLGEDNQQENEKAEPTFVWSYMLVSTLFFCACGQLAMIYDEWYTQKKQKQKGGELLSICHCDPTMSIS